MYFCLQSGFEIGHRADETLNNFCQWQASLKDEIHHDHAILMTGVDICVDKNSPCDTIGTSADAMYDNMNWCSCK